MPEDATPKEILRCIRSFQGKHSEVIKKSGKILNESLENVPKTVDFQLVKLL